MRGLYPRIETPHPPSLREGTFSHKGRRKKSPVVPAKAGTHNHQWLRRDRSHSQLELRLVVMGPGLRRDDGGVYSTISATALPHAVVSAFPPRSRVRSVRSPRVRSIAATIESAACFSPRCSSIIAPDQIMPIGLAMPWPAMSGAEPCTGSNTDGKSPGGLMLPDGAMPMVPVQAGPRSERISPNRFEPTTTSNQSGCSTKFAVRMSMWYLSHFTLG